jgi:hypothetical protein
MALPVTPVEPKDFDIARYEAYAAGCDERYAEFLGKDEGVLVWQRVRAGEVFRDACRDMRVSLAWQLGALAKSLDFLTDAPTYLEPWYGIGAIASAFGAEYTWRPDQAPAVKPVFASLQDMPELAPRPFESVPILRYTRATVEYFLEQTQGRLPLSWCDIQGPINILGGSLLHISQFLVGFYDAPDRLKQLLSTITETIISYYREQAELIGPALARPGHGFASSRRGTGISLSTDNLVMMSPAMYTEFCSQDFGRIGAAFNGVAIHSCGNWLTWLEAVKQTPYLFLVDGAFSPETDPAYNNCEAFRDALAGTGIILHARMVGDPDEVMARVKRLWRPGMRLVVGTHVQEPAAQRQLYRDIHAYCS